MRRAEAGDDYERLGHGLFTVRKLGPSAFGSSAATRSPGRFYEFREMTPRRSGSASSISFIRALTDRARQD